MYIRTYISPGIRIYYHTPKDLPHDLKEGWMNLLNHNNFAQVQVNCKYIVSVTLMLSVAHLRFPQIGDKQITSRSLPQPAHPVSNRPLCRFPPLNRPQMFGIVTGDRCTRHVLGRLGFHYADAKLSDLLKFVCHTSNYAYNSPLVRDAYEAHQLNQAV